MNLIDAAHKTVHDYPGGSQSLGPRIDMSPAVLRNKVNPNNDTHHLSLTEANEIMSVTGDHRILHALSAEHGYVLQRADTQPDVGGLLQCVLVANAAEGEFDRVLQEALSDDLITPNELKAINEAGIRQQATLMMLLTKLRALTEAGRARP